MTNKKCDALKKFLIFLEQVTKKIHSKIYLHVKVIFGENDEIIFQSNPFGF